MVKPRRGQISAEMILILAILLSVVLLIATKMRETASSASASVQNQSANTFGEINRISCVGKACTVEGGDCDSPCSGLGLTCQSGRCA